MSKLDTIVLVPRGDDVYTKAHNNKIRLSIRRIMGVVDSESKQYGDENLHLSFRNNLIVNIFLRWGIFEHSEEKYIEMLVNIYRLVHEHFDFKNPP